MCATPVRTLHAHATVPPSTTGASSARRSPGSSPVSTAKINTALVTTTGSSPVTIGIGTGSGSGRRADTGNSSGEGSRVSEVPSSRMLTGTALTDKGVMSIRSPLKTSLTSNQISHTVKTPEKSVVSKNMSVVKNNNTNSNTIRNKKNVVNSKSSSSSSSRSSQKIAIATYAELPLKDMFPNAEICTFAGGNFWALELAFQRLEGKLPISEITN